MTPVQPASRDASSITQERPELFRATTWTVPYNWQVKTIRTASDRRLVTVVLSSLQSHTHSVRLLVLLQQQDVHPSQCAHQTIYLFLVLQMKAVLINPVLLIGIITTTILLLLSSLFYRFCGSFISPAGTATSNQPVTTCKCPFELTHTTGITGLNNGAASTQVGYSFNYRQIPGNC